MPYTARRFPSFLVQSEIISCLPLTFLLSRVFLYRSYFGCGTAVTIYIYFFFSLLPPIPSRALCTAPLPLFYIHSPSLDSSVHLCSLFLPRPSPYNAAALRGERPGCLFVRFTLDHSYFLSRLSAATPSFVTSEPLARSPAFLSPSLRPRPPPPLTQCTFRSPFPPCPSPLSPTSGVSVVQRGYAQLARRAGARNTRRGHVDSLRSLARLASLCLASLVALLRRGAARRGAFRSPPPPPPYRWTPRRRC